MIEFVLQWNVRSLISHWGQFKHYILSNNPLAAAIQETKFKDSDFDKYTFRIPGYSLYTNNVNTNARRGGTALFVSNKLLHHEIDLSSDQDAVAVKVKIAQRDITLVSLYLTPNKPIDQQAVSSLMRKIDGPCLIMGDFNAHHQTWGCSRNTPRGEIVLDLLEQHNLVFLNDLTPTHTHHHGGRVTHSAIDLALTSPNIAQLFTFNVATDPLFSDHHPIHLELQVPSGQTNFLHLPRWNLRKADWSSFQQHIDEAHTVGTPPDINTFLNTVLAAAHQHIPHTSGHSGRHASPWWNTECQRAVAVRKRALRQFQRCICAAHESEVRRTRKLANQIITKAKQESWQTFASTFNRFTSLSKIWSLLKKFNNKRTPMYKIPHLKVGNATYLFPTEVVAHFAKHFSEISSGDIISQARKLEIEHELSLMDFSSNNDEIYNAPITQLELSLAISKCGQTSVGPDQIHYNFLRNLTENGLNHLLSAYNTLWTEGTFPDPWRTSTLIPLLKSRKPRSLPSSYRPICLTSCACKLFERIVTNRLRVHLETNNKLSPFQNGFRPGRSPANNLVRLIDAIQCGFQEFEVTATLFLDLKAAFDKVNKKALLIKLHGMGIRGRMSKFIHNFLENRTFQVRCGSTLSQPENQIHGVPQGSVISPTLFLIMINDIFEKINQVSPSLKYSLFADDIVIWMTHPSTSRATDFLQLALDQAKSWCDRWGLEIAPSKSALLVFSKQARYERPYNSLKLNGQPVPQVETFKYLGITLDRRLSFNSHFTDVVQRCTRRLNLMKSISSREWGADRSTLLKMYTSLIRPILDYNAFIFDEISSSKIKTLQTIQNTALRIVTGALRTTPTTNLHIDTNIPLLYHRRKYQLLRFYANANSHPSQPIHGIVNHIQAISRRQRRSPRINARINQALKLFDIHHLNTMTTPPLTAYWAETGPDVHRLYTDNKNTVTEAETNALFNELKAQHSAHTFIYTDGSVSDGRAGAAFTLNNFYSKFRLPDKSSIYTAELWAICAALYHIERERLQNVIICSDSLSSLLSIANPKDCRNPLVYEIRRFTKHLSSNHYSIKFLWIPAHAGIPGNVRVDKLAKQSLQLAPQNHLSNPLPDMQRHIQAKLIKLRQREWDEGPHPHLYPIKPKIGHFATSHQNSREKEILIGRLRLGHTKLTHAYIIQQTPPPTCYHCQPTTRCTIQHILLHCRKHAVKRQSIMNYIQNKRLQCSLATVLGDEHPELIELVIQFLYDTRLAMSI